MKNKTTFSFHALGILVAIAILGLSSSAYAEKSAVKVEDIKGEQDTTISIKKGPNADPNCQFEIVAGDAEIEGDPSYSAGDARKSWKLACDSWKKEIRELNPNNQLIALSCNSVTVDREGGDKNQFVARSKGSYKSKIRGEEKIRENPEKTR